MQLPKLTGPEIKDNVRMNLVKGHFYFNLKSNPFTRWITNMAGSKPRSVIYRGNWEVLG
jgi:hypothetical protein